MTEISDWKLFVLGGSSVATGIGIAAGNLWMAGLGASFLSVSTFCVYDDFHSAHMEVLKNEGTATRETMKKCTQQIVEALEARR